MRWRLRYLQHDLELSEGQFAVGRNATCQLSLDDPLVSRRHALLTVTDEGVTIEDLSSRNGVLVNGKRIAGRVDLQVGDRILIGAQELTLLQGKAVSRDYQPTTGNAKMTLPKMEPALRLPGDVAGAATPSSPPHEGSSAEIDPSMVRRADAFKLLGGVAEKALAMGRAVEAERLLASPLADVIEASRAGRRLPSGLVDQAAKFSSKLATATSKGAWADYVIELYAAQGRPCPAPVIDELYIAMRKVATVDVNRLREYLAQLRGRLSSFGPAERFLFQRLEGLERLAALR
ncbi:MAG TPA: FHA domain-containing protein [Polyangiaceae bacterium]|jgi:predicted component of type VI protein secretion system